jgi:transcriptional regulator with XRE-family HTH domain
MPEETREEKKARMARAGAWLHAERDKRGLSQTAMAQALGLPPGSQNRISNYENGVYEVNDRMIPDIARVLGLPEYDTARGLEAWLPAEVASRRRLIRYAFSLMNNKDAEDLFDLVARSKGEATRR